MYPGLSQCYVNELGRHSFTCCTRFHLSASRFYAPWFMPDVVFRTTSPPNLLISAASINISIGQRSWGTRSRVNSSSNHYSPQILPPNFTLLLSRYTALWLGPPYDCDQCSRGPEFRQNAKCDCSAALLWISILFCGLITSRLQVASLHFITQS